MGDSQVHAWHRTLLIGSVGLVSVAAWFVLWRFGSALHSPIHAQHADTGLAFGAVFVGAWSVMTTAMMLPTAVPLVATFHAIAGERPDRPVLISIVIVGYLLIWGAVGLLFYAGRVVVHAWPWWDGNALRGSAIVLLIGGAYQFTDLKYRCLDKCRSPLSFVLGYWRGEKDRRNALRLGIHHGLFCVGCCWALMLLMFAVGVGNLAWMLALGAVMAIEKNVSWGRRISAPLGAVLVLGGLSLLALA